MITISNEVDGGREARTPADALEADQDAHHARVDEETAAAVENATEAFDGADPVTQAFADAVRSSDESLSRKAAATTSYGHGTADAEYAAGHTVKENVVDALDPIAAASTELNLDYGETQELLDQVVGAQACAMLEDGNTEPAGEHGTEQTYGPDHALQHGVVTQDEHDVLADAFGLEYDLLDATKDDIAEAYLNEGLYTNKGAAYSRAGSQARVYNVINELLED